MYWVKRLAHEQVITTPQNIARPVKTTVIQGQSADRSTNPLQWFHTSIGSTCTGNYTPNTLWEHEGN